MKKILLFTAICCGALAFTSCSKKSDYTCTCAISNTGVSVNEPIKIFDMTESDAKEVCDAGSTVATVTCTLK
jgi:hypothetical protein